jgi:hypothetical protein
MVSSEHKFLLSGLAIEEQKRLKDQIYNGGHLNPHMLLENMTYIQIMRTVSCNTLNISDYNVKDIG